ncbi:FAD binding domain-containing protein [Streptomyces sp. NBC_01304]|uniref:FAD binding domain-containing protein n=1 Tax=Streptomyces sp. NBC_01304 TaxID=2903818 RepID=UPI002E11BC8C|nr:xanthine dehydrogenase family protein subunit M [Streptomyces sp. NBC_01304]
MQTFDYLRAASPTEAVAAVTGAPGTRFLAGGTNLVDLMKLGVERPDRLVDIGRLPLDRIEETVDGGLRIGATVRNSDLAAHPLVRERWPALSQALLAGASGQVRNAATVGGNLLQRTRCGYFQDTSKPCNKRVPGSGCPARTGAHRDLAILGTSESCVATYPGDMAVALAAFDARVRLLGPDGATRTVELTGFHRLPGDDPARDTVLAHGELITAVELPPLPVAARSVYRKVRDRASYAFALASCAAAIDVQDGVVREVRLAYGSLAPRPWRALAAETFLTGRPATAESFAAAADAELAAARPLPGNAFKAGLARNLTVQLLTDLTEGAR